MNTAGIFIKTEPEIKKKAEKTAKELGFDLNSIINAWLHQFIQVKKTDLDENGEIPSEYLDKMIRQAEIDLKAGKASPTFKTAEDAVAYLEKQGI